MKKTVAILMLVFVLIVTCAACDPKGKQDGENNGSSNVTTAQNGTPANSNVVDGTSADGATGATSPDSTEDTTPTTAKTTAIDLPVIPFD